MASADVAVVALNNPSTGATAQVCLHGAHLLSWRPRAGADEVLFVSSKTKFSGAGVAIRGGVPVCFPQFAAQGPLMNHGFARTSDEWAHVVAAAPTGVAACATATLELVSSDASRAIWPQEFRTQLVFTLCDDGALAIEWRVTNTGGSTFTFTQALHTYFRAVASSARVFGLTGRTYIDKTDAMSRKVDESPAVSFAREVDRAYLDTPSALRLETGLGAREIFLSTRGFADAVVWNPWVEKAAAMRDLGDGEYADFVCVESGNVGTGVVLAPEASWEGALELRVSE
eukprot:Amastigsp_a174667_196.p2 type:complete len:286 gc:universal Amastigsp_a174667_196:23-880(+)